MCNNNNNNNNLYFKEYNSNVIIFNKQCSTGVAKQSIENKVDHVRIFFRATRPIRFLIIIVIQ